MATCGVCTEDLASGKELVKCVGRCCREFHLDCVARKFPEIKKTRGSKNTWTCEECRGSPRPPPSSGSSKASDDSTAITKGFLVSMLNDFKTQMFAAIKEQSVQIEEFKNSLHFVSSKLDETSKALDQIKQQNKQILKENAELKLSKDVLKVRVGELEGKVRDLEQYSRRENIEVNGLPQTPGENLMKLVQDLGRAVGVDMQPEAVVAAHRVPTYNQARTPPLIVRFAARPLRDALLDAYRRRKTLLASDVNSHFPRNRIYIGEHLTPANKILLRNLKEVGRELNVKYVWTRGGKFFARKSEGQKVLK